MNTGGHKNGSFFQKTLINKNEIKSQKGVPIFTKNFTTLIYSPKIVGKSFMDPLLNVSAVIIGKLKI
jgi:hypothetical protein